MNEVKKVWVIESKKSEINPIQYNYWDSIDKRFTSIGKATHYHSIPPMTDIQDAAQQAPCSVTEIYITKDNWQ